MKWTTLILAASVLGAIHPGETLAQDVGRTTAALSLGTSSPDAPATNTTVSVNGASGTLVATNMVLTNGHVARVQPPPDNPPFSLTNPVYPDRWYRIPDRGVLVSITTARFGPFGVGADGRSLTSRTRLHVTSSRAGTLRSGDVIGLKTSNNRYLFVNGGGMNGTVEIDQLYDRFGAWQALTLEKVSGGGPEIRSFDRVALRAPDGTYIGPIAGRENPRLRADSRTRTDRHEFGIMKVGGTGEIQNGDEVAFIAGRAGGNGWIQYPLVYSGTHISLPGYDDLALVRLDRHVPADAASTTRVLLHLPAGISGPAAFYQGKRLRAAGFGQVAGGLPAPQRQFGHFANVRPAGLPSVFAADGVDGAGIMCGDSGGSWFWDETSSSTWLVGVTQRGGCGPGASSGGMFISTLSEGGTDRERNSKPDLTAWYALHLRQDNCRPVTAADRRSSRAFTETGATEVCSFGGVRPYVYALFGGASDGADCLAVNSSNLSLERPTQTTEWRLRDGNRRIMGIPGSWQQSYTRGAYLIDFVRRRGISKVCYVDRPNPSFVYFR